MPGARALSFMVGQAIDGGKDVMHTTIYNDDSQNIEYLKSDRKTEITPSPHSIDELVKMMMGSENAVAEAIIRKAGRNS
jgi:hypothetical protein